MKAKKEILLAIEYAKKEILDAIEKKPVGKIEKTEKVEKKPKRRKMTEDSPLKEHFEALSAMLDYPTKPTRFKIMTVVAPLADALEKEEGVTDGLLDILSPDARKSVLMLFLFNMLKDADEQQKPDYPDKVPLDVSDGDNIPNGVMEGQTPYNKKPRGKLDKGF